MMESYKLFPEFLPIRKGLTQIILTDVAAFVYCSSTGAGLSKLLITSTNLRGVISALIR